MEIIVIGILILGSLAFAVKTFVPRQEYNDLMERVESLEADVGLMESTPRDCPIEGEIDD